jgi:hypothetical protein
MMTFYYKGLLVTKTFIGLGPRFVSILLPCGKRITGHSVCTPPAGVIRHYSDGNILPPTRVFYPNTEEVSSSKTAPSVTPVMSFRTLEDLLVISTIKKALTHTAGVYAFRNIDTGEIVYVGSSVDMARRVNEHLKGKTSNSPLQHAFKKYGIKSFILVVLEVYTFDFDLSVQENRDLILAMEQKYLDSFKPRYNISPTAGSPLGVTRSEETRAKIRAAFLGIPLSDEQRLKSINASQHRYKPVYFYDEAKNLVTMYESLNATCRAESANKNNMLQCINTGKLFRGYLVSYNPIN